MKIEKYYRLVKDLGEDVKNFDRSILNALDNDQPSVWVPDARKSLLKFYKNFSEFEKSEEVLRLYAQGEIFEYKTDIKLSIVIGIVCFGIGVYVGWFL